MKTRPLVLESKAGDAADLQDKVLEPHLTFLHVEALARFSSSPGCASLGPCCPEEPCTPLPLFEQEPTAHIL